jgi:uncharacterized protein
MEFEWDPAKASSNIAKHGVPFEYAARVFLDPLRIDRADTRRAYGEPRRIAVGEIEGRLFVVSYTPRGRLIRLISARKANRRERKGYDGSIHA